MSGIPLIAVVDDDVSVRESLPGLLSTLGFRATGFASARAFLESSTMDRTDCLILDVAMPEMTGPELARELATRRREIPIVYITANENEANRRALLAQGAAACLYKPFTEATLVAALRTALPGTASDLRGAR